MDDQSQLPCPVEGVSRLIGSVVPQNRVLKSNACSVDGYVFEVKILSFEGQIVVGEFGCSTPVFDCSIVEGVQVDRANGTSLFDGVNVVLFEQVEDVLSDLTVVQISVHL